MKTHEPSRQNLNSRLQWREDGGSINKSIPALEDDDNVLTFYWHIGQTDKWEGGRERVGMPRSRSINQWEKSWWKSIYVHITHTSDLSFSHGGKHVHLYITLQVDSISYYLCACPLFQTLGYFGFSIGSAASHLTSLRHGFITEPDATRMPCVCVSHVTHLRAMSCLGNCWGRCNMLPCSL